MLIAAGVLSDQSSMATAVRFVLGKLGIRRSSSVSVANMVDVIKTLNVNQVMFPIPVLAPSRLNLNLSYSSGRYRNCDETCQPLPHLPLEYWEVRTYLLEYISCDYWNLCLYMYKLLCY